MGLFGFSPKFNEEEQEEWNAFVWGRLAEIGIASEEYAKACEENPEEGDARGLLELAVDEAEMQSRSWWRKLL